MGGIVVCPTALALAVESEKRQTLLHELLLLIRQKQGVAPKRGLAYGETNCQWLSKKSPKDAIRNAESVAYFVRDVGMNSNAQCMDQASVCRSWTEKYKCNKEYTFGFHRKHLREVC